jgi:hypothetical protein
MEEMGRALSSPVFQGCRKTVSPVAAAEVE